MLFYLQGHQSTGNIPFWSIKNELIFNPRTGKPCIGDYKYLM